MIKSCNFTFIDQNTGNLLGINRNTINRYFNQFRQAIFLDSVFSSRVDWGEFELDESYFGKKRVRGKRGRGAAGKTPVFGLLKREGKVYLEIVENCFRDSLVPIIQGKILQGSTIHTDGWKAYDGIILNGYDHYRVFYFKECEWRSNNRQNDINGLLYKIWTKL